MATSLDLNFGNFCKAKSQKDIPGINDDYSREDYKEFKEKIEKDFTTIKKVSEKRNYINSTIFKAKDVSGNVQSMLNAFDKDQMEDFIENTFPRGYNLEDIDKLKLEQINNSAKLFKELFEKLFNKKYGINTGDLENIFGSITNYSRIATNSFGFMSISNLWSIFQQYYLEYKNDKPFGKIEFFKTFFTKCINQSSLEEVLKEKQLPFFDKINNEIQYNEFNSEIWYNNQTAFPTNFDSYGFFYVKNTSSTSSPVNKNYVYLKFSSDVYIECLNKRTGANKQVMHEFFTDYLNTSPKNTGITTQIGAQSDFKERILDRYSPETFKNSVAKYFSENRKRPETLLKEINGKTNYVEIEYDTDIYKSIRALLHFSNIYTTYFKLLEHFFTNIIECYYIYLSLCTELKSSNKNNNAIPIEYINEIQKKLRYLLDIIKKIPESFQKMLVNYKTNTSFTEKFLGFTNLNYEYFINYNITNPDKFMRILMIFFKTNEQYFPIGGIPLVLNKNTSQFKKDIITSLLFFIKYRLKSNIDYISLLEFYKHQANQKLTVEKYTSVKQEVTKKINELDKLIQPAVTNEDIFNNCKVILKFSIIYFINLLATTVKDFKHGNGKFKTETDILLKIGELKEYLNQYILQLRNKLNGPQYSIFHQFLYGNLSKYIYFAENFGKTKSSNNYEKLQIILTNKTKANIDKIVDDFVEILTKNSSIVEKRRFGIVGRKYETLSEDAKSIIDNQINPEIYTSTYWANYEKKFMETNENKKLFVLAVEPWINIHEKISKVNVYIIDFFQTLKSNEPPKIKSAIQTIETFESNDKKAATGTISRNTINKIRYSNKNNIIELSHTFRTIKDIAGKIQKSWSRNIKNPIKKKLFSRFFSAEGLHSPGFFDVTPGHRFAKALGIIKKKPLKNSEGKTSSQLLGYTATENLRLLINGDLFSEYDDNKINFSLLMGYNDNQLNNIKTNYTNYLDSKLDNNVRPIFGDPKKLNKYKYDPENKENDWQIYVIKKEDYESSNKMREWANRLLNSKPLILKKKYIEEPDMIPYSYFSKIQAPFSRYFIKSWWTHRFLFTRNTTDYLLHIYNLIYEKDKSSPNQLFYSAETFFDYNIQGNITNNIEIQPNLSKSKTKIDTTKLLAIKNNVEYREVAGIPEISKKLTQTLKPGEIKLNRELTSTRNRIVRTQNLNISSSLSLQDDLLKKFIKFLKNSNVNLNTITIEDETRNKINLKFNIKEDDFSIEYGSKKANVNFDKKKNVFTARIIFKESTVDRNEIFIQFEERNIYFFKIEKEYMLVMKLDNDDDGFFLQNDYSTVSFRNIFNENLTFKHKITNGFLFYSNTEYSNDYLLKFLDNIGNTIFDVSFGIINNEIQYKNYKKEQNYYISGNKAIISIPRLEVYEKTGMKINKLEQSDDYFEWNEKATASSKSNFTNLLFSRYGNSNAVAKKFLFDSINQFIKRSRITQSMLSNNNIFTIEMDNGDIYTIDIDNLEIMYNIDGKKESKKIIFKDRICVIQISDYTDINKPDKFFTIDKNSFKIVQYFDSEKMNFKGQLDLEIVKKGEKFMLNCDYSKNDDIKEFLGKTKIASLILERLFENPLNYHNFLEIYIGESKDDNAKSLLFRPLGKDRQPIPFLNFSFEYTKTGFFLQQNTADDEDKFINFTIDGNFIYTDTNFEFNKIKYMIILDFNKNKIYLVNKSEKNTNSSPKVYELTFDNGYIFKRMTLNASLKGEIEEITNKTGGIP